MFDQAGSVKKAILSSVLLFSGAVFFFAIIRPSGQSGRPAASVPAAAGGKSNSPIELLNASGLQNIVHRRNGKILILNVWATWCLPCAEEFPDLNKIALGYDTDKVEVVGVSLDYADERESKVIPFIEKNNVPFKIYLAHFDSQEEFIDSVQKSWSGAIPATFIYDRNGRQKFILIGEQTFERFKAAVDTVLRFKLIDIFTRDFFLPKP